MRICHAPKVGILVSILLLLFASSAFSEGGWVPCSAGSTALCYDPASTGNTATAPPAAGTQAPAPNADTTQQQNQGNLPQQYQSTTQQNQGTMPQQYRQYQGSSYQMVPQPAPPYQGTMYQQYQGNTYLPYQQYQGNMPQQYQGNMPQQYQGNMPQQYQGNMPQQYQGNMPQQYQGNMPQQYQGNMPQQYQGNMPQQYQDPLSSQQYQDVMPQQQYQDGISSQQFQPLQQFTPQLEPPLTGILQPVDATGRKMTQPALQTPVTGDQTQKRPGTQDRMQRVEFSVIEQAMAATSRDAAKPFPEKFVLKRLEQFGYNFFRGGAASFAPLSDVPVGPEYLIGAGDRFTVTVWGSIEGSFSLEVNRSGEVVLPKVGALKVAGINFGSLPEILKAHLSRVYKDFQINLTMGKLRMIKVYVVGEVNMPGDYSISSLSTVINALSAAGGPGKNGSLRKIAIRRNGKLVDTVDLYDFFLKGDKSRDIRLQPGDTVFVPPIGPVTGIVGTVRRPAIYELKDEKNLKDLLELADGVVSSGYLQRLQITRIDAHEKKSVTDVNLDPKNTGASMESLAAGIPIRDMDLVKIFPIDGTLRGYVHLEGYILRPGDYALKPGMKLSHLLTSDIMLPEYYTSIGRIERLIPPALSPEVIIFNPANAIKGVAGFDLELTEFDTVRIYSRWEMEEMPKVRVSGDVQRPGDYRLFNNMTVRDLLYTAGNVKLNAYLKNAEISRMQRSGERVTTTSLTIDLERALSDDKEHNIALQPFDELFIRRIPDWTSETERYIMLRGEFKFPGKYAVYKGERLSSVIKRAGGYTERAYLRAAKFTRESVRLMQQQRMNEFVVRAEQEISSKMSAAVQSASSAEELAANRAALEGVQKNLQLMKSMKAEGRMVTRLDEPDRFTSSSFDIEVMGGDVLDIPQSTNAVSMLGKVFNATSFVARPGKTVGDYIEAAGGIVRDGDASEVYVMRADGSIFSRQQYSFMSSLFGRRSFNKERIEAGDTIIVPEIMERTAVIRNIKDITTIMSQIAVTAGTVLIGLR